MSKSMKMIKSQLSKIGIKPTNSTARKYLHYLRKHERMKRAVGKVIDSLLPRYKPPYYFIEEENNG